MSPTEQVAVLLQQGIAAVKAGQKQQARQVLLRVVELDEQSEHAWLWLSETVESLEDKRICLENVLTLNPDSAHAQAGLRWIEQQSPVSPDTSVSPDTQDNCPHCGAAIPPSGATCPHCRQPLIIVCPACGQYVDVSQTACPDCGQHWGDFRAGMRYHLALAQAYVERRKLDLAQQAIAHAEAASADDPQALASVAALYEGIERPDLAEAVCERAIQGSPGNAELYIRLGTIYQHTSRFDQARTMYQKAKQLDANNPTVHYKMARLRIQEAGVTPKAIALLQQAIKLEPEHAPSHLLLGDVYFKQQKLKQAQKHYRQACQLTSSDSALGQQAYSKLAKVELLSQPQERSRPAGAGQRAKPRQRPGCVTLYAVLSASSAACSGLSLAGVSGNEISLALVFTLAMAICNLAIAVGLWSLQNWARILVIIVSVLTLLGTIIQFALVMNEVNALSSYPQYQEISNMMSSMFACIAVPIVLTDAYIIFWFWTNGELFD